MPTSRRNLPGLLFLRRRALRASVPVNALRFPCAQSCARRSTDVTGYSRVYLVQHVRGEPPAITPASSSGQSFMHSLHCTFLTERCCFVRVSWEVRRLDHRCGERRTNATGRCAASNPRAPRPPPPLQSFTRLRCIALHCFAAQPKPSPVVFLLQLQHMARFFNPSTYAQAASQAYHSGARQGWRSFTGSDDRNPG